MKTASQYIVEKFDISCIDAASVSVWIELINQAREDALREAYKAATEQNTLAQVFSKGRPSLPYNIDPILKLINELK